MCDDKSMEGQESPTHEINHSFYNPYIIFGIERALIHANVVSNY